MMTRPDRETVFQDIYRRNRWRLARICRVYAAGDDGADLLQDIWIHIWNGLDRFRGEAQVDTWVYRVAVNSALMFRRSSGRRQRWIEPGQDVEILAQKDAASPAADIPEHLRRLLYHCVSLLKPRDRLVVSLHLEGLEHGAIAEIVGVTAGHAAVLLHRLKPVLAVCVQGGSNESI
jgi:RNA polymerase sigma-70 factor (ECF subfamily)